MLERHGTSPLLFQLPTPVRLTAEGVLAVSVRRPSVAAMLHFAGIACLLQCCLDVWQAPVDDRTAVPVYAVFAVAALAVRRRPARSAEAG